MTLKHRNPVPADHLLPITSLLWDIWHGVLDLIYPPKCVVCGDIQPRYFCEDCLSRVTYIPSPVCRKCGLPLEQPTCPQQWCPDLAFTSARAVAFFEGAVREAIHQLKYSGHVLVAPELQRLMTEFLSTKPNFASSVQVVMPIPIHRSRLRERGFNQSILLAEAVAEFLRLPLDTTSLERRVANRPQVELSVWERIENVKGVFGVANPDAVADKSILLIDDVLTTGSTCSEAARVLRSAGAKHIYALTLARSC